MLQLSCNFDRSIWYTNWIIILTNASCTNYVIDKHDDLDQYAWYVLSSYKMACYNYAENLVGSLDRLIQLLC